MIELGPQLSGNAALSSHCETQLNLALAFEAAAPTSASAAGGVSSGSGVLREGREGSGGDGVQQTMQAPTPRTSCGFDIVVSIQVRSICIMRSSYRVRLDRLKCSRVLSSVEYNRGIRSINTLIRFDSNRCASIVFDCIRIFELN